MVGKMTVIYTKYFIDYLDSLVYILYKKEYFGFIESADVYIDKIYEFIEQDIQNFPARKTPETLKNFRSNYIFYKSNQRTTWYIFFEKMNDNYLITNIINSNSEEVKFL